MKHLLQKKIHSQKNLAVLGYYQTIDLEALGDEGLLEVVKKRDSTKARLPFWHELKNTRVRATESQSL